MRCLRYRMAVSYTDDEVDHEGILVWPVSLVHRFVLQPDDDCWVEDSGTASWNNEKTPRYPFPGTGTPCNCEKQREIGANGVFKNTRQD